MDLAPCLPVTQSSLRGLSSGTVKKSRRDRGMSRAAAAPIAPS
jgi:hypothetical protein